MIHGLTLQIDAQTERLLRERAQQDGLSVEEEAQRILDRGLRPHGETFWRKVDLVRESLAGLSFPDSSALIREDRAR